MGPILRRWVIVLFVVIGVESVFLEERGGVAGHLRPTQPNLIDHKHPPQAASFSAASRVAPVGVDPQYGPRHASPGDARRLGGTPGSRLHATSSRWSSGVVMGRPFAGYFGGWVDTVINWLNERLPGLPMLLFAIALNRRSCRAPTTRSAFGRESATSPSSYCHSGFFTGPLHRADLSPRPRAVAARAGVVDAARSLGARGFLT